MRPLLDWFRQVPTVRHLLTDYRTLLALPEVDVVYVALPHHLHEEVYRDVLRAGKDLFAEKPFGFDLDSAKRIRDEATACKRFVRVSSEFPFLPGAQRAIELVSAGSLGRILEASCAFLHSSDLDPSKTINWKRQSRYCGEADRSGVEPAAKDLIHAGVRRWVIIHFPEGAYACGQSGIGLWQDSLVVPADRIKGAAGAGDAFAAGVLFGLHEDWPMQRSLLLGVAAAAMSLFHPTCSDGIQPATACLTLATEFAELARKS